MLIILLSAGLDDGWSAQTLTKIIWSARTVANGDNTHALAAQNVGHVKRKTRQVYPSVACGSLPPKQRVQKDGGSDAFDLLTKVHA